MASTYEELMAASRQLYEAGDIDGARRVAKIAIERRDVPNTAPKITAEQRAANVAANASRQAEIDTAGLKQIQPPQNSFTGAGTQFGIGSQEGIASALGFPADGASGLLNAFGDVTGLYSRDKFDNPAGGSRSILKLLKPFHEGMPGPETGLERGARRVGQEVGGATASGPLLGLSAATRAAPLASAAVEGATALGGGIGGAVANEIAPNSIIADMIGALLGGLPSGAIAARATGLGGMPATVVDGLTDQRQRAAGAYREVRADRRRLPQDSIDDMALGLSGRMDAERINPRLHPGSSAIMDAILQDSSGPMRIADIEDLRRLTTAAMPATASPADARLSGMMKDEITAYLDNLKDPIADRLKDGRDAHRRASATQSVVDLSDKAARRAASTGSGGNEINATRQNLRTILDNPRKGRSFTAAERELIDSVVRGTGPQNIARRVSRFAPSGGGLSAMLGMAGIGAMPQIAAPAIALAEIGKYMGERSTKAGIAQLLQSLAPDKVLNSRSVGTKGLSAALLAARTAVRDRQ